MSDQPADEPKLIIDEDWKTQVQREKEEAKQKQKAEAQGEAPSPATEPTAAQSAAAQSNVADQGGGEDEEDLPPPPPASLPLLITTLATQAMAALGQMPDESGQPLPVNLDYARHFIDLIAVLEEKTKGNLTAEEQPYLTETLHQLRLAYVAVRNRDRS